MRSSVEISGPRAEGTTVAVLDAGAVGYPGRPVSRLPLRIRFGLAVATSVASVLGAFWWVTTRVAASPSARLWFTLSSILLVTLLVDRVARRLMYRRLAHIRETMQRIASGDMTARVSIHQLDEIGVIARGLNDILQGLERLNEAVEMRVEAAAEVFRRRSVQDAESNREMAALSDELARAGRLAALGQAAANMAHQIGTPLNLMSGHVQLLIQTFPPESAVVERLKVIQDQITKITAIVRAALDSSRPPAIPHERADLSAMVRRLCQMVRPMLEDANVDVHIDAPSEPVEVVADVVQLELALLNLITNGVDAMASGGTLTLRLTRLDDQVRLEVEDTGAGIPSDLAPDIFSPWVTTKPQGKGSGLGLSITRQVVVTHGGTIRADNRLGRGAVFTIELPAVTGHPEHAENSRR